MNVTTFLWHYKNVSVLKLNGHTGSSYETMIKCTSSPVGKIKIVFLPVSILSSKEIIHTSILIRDPKNENYYGMVPSKIDGSDVRQLATYCIQGIPAFRDFTIRDPRYFVILFQ